MGTCEETGDNISEHHRLLYQLENNGCYSRQTENKRKIGYEALDMGLPSDIQQQKRLYHRVYDGELTRDIEVVG